MSEIEEVWNTWPADIYFEVYGQLGDSTDWDVINWCRKVVLQAHVDACRETELEPRTPGERHPRILYCGAGWYCDKAKEILELGKC